MARKNYYVLLGVPQDETAHGIRNAFRDLARRYHPDRAGPRSTRSFQDIVEAYQVLGDSQRRAAYDRGLSHERTPGSAGRQVEVRVAPAPQEPEPARWDAPEPLLRRRRRARPEPLVREDVSVMRDFEVSRPARDTVHDRFERNFTEEWRRKPEGLEPLDLVVRIGPEQAMRGGELTLTVPVLYPCGYCHGTGRVFGYGCAPCRQSGMLEEETPVRVRVPPMVRTGTVLEVPLRGAGVHNLYLRLRVEVDR